MWIPSLPVTDLAPLRGMPLKELWCAGTKVTDVRVLVDMPLEVLFLPTGADPKQVGRLKGKAFRTFASTGDLMNPKRMKLLFEGTRLERFEAGSDKTLTDLNALKGHPLTYLNLTGSSNLRDIAGLADSPDLGVVWLQGTAVADLKALQGKAKLRELYAAGCPRLTSIAPLAGAKSLTTLWVSGTNVRDFSPLVGANSLHSLLIDSPADPKGLKPLAGLPKLKALSLQGPVGPKLDLAPLTTLPALEHVHIEVTPRVKAVLKQLPGLKEVNREPADRVLK